MNLFRKKPALKPIREDFTQVAAAQERLCDIVKALREALPEHIDQKNFPVLNDASARLLYMMMRSIPSGPRNQFDGNPAQCLSSGLISFQNGRVDSLFKQPEYLSKIMDFIETSRAARAISPYEEMYSMCQLAYASAVEAQGDHEEKRAKENVALILDRLGESQNLYASSALVLISRLLKHNVDPEYVKAGQIIQCLSRIQKNQAGVEFSQEERVYMDAVFSILVKDILADLSPGDPGSFHTVSQVAGLMLSGGPINKGKGVWDVLVNFKSARFADQVEKLGAKPGGQSVPPLDVTYHFVD